MTMVLLKIMKAVMFIRAMDAGDVNEVHVVDDKDNENCDNCNIIITIRITMMIIKKGMMRWQWCFVYDNVAD